jgi:hypothetical protein
MDMGKTGALRIVKFYPESVSGQCKACRGFYDMNSLKARKDHMGYYTLACADMTRCHSALTVTEVIVGILPAHAEHCGCRSCNHTEIL